MFIDIDCSQVKKFGQNAFGDYFISKRTDNQERVLAVLSDGLGSGVKANILSCMTSTMLLRFIEEDIPIQKAAQIIIESLPVCQIRKISYATFSAVDCRNDGSVWIVEEGNPSFLLIRNGEEIPLECETIFSPKHPDRHLHLYKFMAQVGDRLVFCSDGVTQSALGSKELRLGIRREGLIKLIQEKLKQNKDVSSHELSNYIVKQAVLTEPDHKAKDDVSAVSFYFREPRHSVIFTGPPYHQDKDNFYAKMFESFNGKKAVCGGTTANLLSRELKIPVETQISLNCGKLPSVSFMKGIDLVTEGILTLTKACEYLENGEKENNAAGQLVDFLLDTDCITFMVGAKLNQAHYDPALPIEIEIRKNVIKRMSDILEKKYIKKVIVQYM